MKFKNVDSLNEIQKLKLKRILGVRHKLPVMFAELRGTKEWSILRAPNDGPLNADRNLKQIATLHSLEDVLQYFKKEELTPYCPAIDINHNNSGKRAADRDKSKDVLHRRSQFRKNVSLKGKIMNKRTLEKQEVLINDLSFNGASFFTIDHPAILKGDTLYLEFILNNRKESKIERKLEVKHVSGKRVGGSFVNKPSLDADLGFYLMFDVK